MRLIGNIIAPGMISDQFEGSLAVRDGRGRTTTTSLWAWGRVSAGVFFKAKPQAQEKVKGQEHENHVPMPGWPGTVFIFSHADVLFSIFKTLLDPPAQSGSMGQFGQRHIFRGIGESIFHLSVGGASDQQPDGSFLGSPWCAGKTLRQARSAKIGPFAPSARMMVCQTVLRDLAICFTACGCGWPRRTLSFLGEVLGPNKEVGRLSVFSGRLGVRANVGQVKDLFGQRSQESGVGAEGGITADPLSGKEFFFHNPLDQGQGDLGLGLEGEILGTQLSWRRWA